MFLKRELQGLSCDSPENEEEKDNGNQLVSPTVEETPPPPKASGDIITLLEDRLKLYNEAVAAAKAMNDNSKARRYGRAVKVSF